MNRLSLIIFLAFPLIAGWPSRCPALDQLGPQTPAVSLASVATYYRSDHPPPGKGCFRVETKRQGAAFQLYRGAEPYFIKGVGGRRFLETAAAAGANSVRTWGPHDAAALLDRAQSLNMTVTLGIWLSHHPADYHEPSYKMRKTEEIQRLVELHKNHPALLLWALGNEINLEGEDTEATWRFVNDLVCMIKQQDDHHPVISVIACSETTLDNIAAFAPALDAVGINAYGTLTYLRAIVDRSSYTGPYIITEWGVTGHWEAERTSWGRPIEPTSTWKAEFQLSRYRRDILANSDRCIGSYVFFWGQKQERTPTWYSMILEDLPGIDPARLSYPAVDAMHFNWTGNWPANRAPEMLNMVINGITAHNNIILSPGEPMVSRVEARDPENDQLTYVWELLEEPTVLGRGGSQEPRPRSLATVKQDKMPVVNLSAPLAAGEYRLFVYVLDHQGHASTANIPFQVRLSSES